MKETRCSDIQIKTAKVQWGFRQKEETQHNTLPTVEKKRVWPVAWIERADFWFISGLTLTCVLLSLVNSDRQKENCHSEKQLCFCPPFCLKKYTYIYTFFFKEVSCFLHTAYNEIPWPQIPWFFFTLAAYYSISRGHTYELQGLIVQ